MCNVQQFTGKFAGVRNVVPFVGMLFSAYFENSCCVVAYFLCDIIYFIEA